MENENGIKLAQAISQLGFDCECVKGVISPRFEIYYFNLHNVLQINDFGMKQIKILEKVFSTRLFFDKELVDYSFSIGFEHKEFVLPYQIFKGESDHNQQKVFIGVDMLNQDVCLNFYDNINHILIGGSTGSGKSTLLNTMITNLIQWGGVWLPKTPYIFLLDPKKVEFAKFKGLWETDYQCENDEIANKLSWLVRVMEQRYKDFESKGYSDYKQANYKPYFVFVDELADLMMSGIESIEQDIIRLAQKGRGAGIHLILATQNPIAKVCTSLIKSNMTTRIALKCATKMQSIVMLDHIGAEKLLGKGDAILKLPNKVDEIRFQCAYCNDEFIKNTLQIKKDYYNSRGGC